MTWFDVLTASLVAQFIGGGSVYLLMRAPGFLKGFVEGWRNRRRPPAKFKPGQPGAFNPLEALQIGQAVAAITGQPAPATPESHLHNVGVLGAPGESIRDAAHDPALLISRAAARNLWQLLREAESEVELERPQLAVRLRRLRESLNVRPGPVSGLEANPHVN